MADITWDDVTALAPELVSVAVSKQDLILEQVNSELSPTVWGSRINIGRRYLAAHLGAVLQDAETGGVTGAVLSETVGAVSRTYANPDSSDVDALESTWYGSEFLRISRTLPAARFALGE